MWLVFALLSPLFWAIVHVLDSHCVEQIFDRPWMGVITSSLASFVVLLFLPFVAVHITWDMPSLQVITLALIAGTLIQLSQAFYFQSLAYSEPGIVAAYWNLTPALLPLASYLLLGRVLRGEQYFGIVVLIVASVFFCLLDTNGKTRWRSFLLMLIASSIQVISVLLEKYTFDHSPFGVGFLLVTTGIILSGSLPLLLRRVRRLLLRSMQRFSPAIATLIGIEIVNLIALLMSQRALSLGIPSVVAAVETIIPAYTFILSMVFVFLVGASDNYKPWYRLRLKFLLVGLMSIGIYLVS